MSDEPTAAQPPAPATTARLDKPADAYGQPISDLRQAELQGYLDRWQAETDHGDRKGPFHDGPRQAGVRLTGADVSWLAEQSGRDQFGFVPNLHLEGASLREARLDGADLSEARLERADLSEARLERADLSEAHLEGANFREAHLEGANFREAHLERADLSLAHLERAFLVEAHLERAFLGSAHLDGAFLGSAHLDGAFLGGAQLDGADLSEAQLERADLRSAHLDGANLIGAHLEGAYLRGAWLDSKTVLRDATLDSRTRLGDIQWGGVGAVNLTQIDWSRVPRLGDERGVGIRSDIDDHERAVRAYRQLAAQLRAQGLSEVADRFADRAQVRQRKLLFRQVLADWRRPWRLPGDLARWLFSWFLALLAGYGYHPGRSVFWYLATIAGFAFMYMQATRGWIPFGLPHPSQLAALPWYEALILSVSSFHGRGFFQPLQSLGDPVAALASIEAVIGLLIEISFIATFTQRFFGSR